MENVKDPQVWAVAQKRASFKRSLTMYVLVNLFLVGVWYFTSDGNSRHFWPLWPMLGWGLGIGIQYLNAYQGTTFFSAEKEYDKLNRH